MAAGGVLVGRGYVSIRPEFEGDWSRSVNARAGSAGRSGAGAFSKAFGAGLRGVGALAGVAIAANLSSAAGAAAALAPALATAGTAAAALKIGMSGVGAAFKEAFADSTSQASGAASATRAVESAQRGLANAQRALADARVQAAERVKDALRGVEDAERALTRTVEESAQRQKDAQRQVKDAIRELTDAQREAAKVQATLTEARREAARELEDLNTKLAESRLDEREATRELADAEEALKAAEAKPGNALKDVEELRLARDRAALALKEQQTESKRLGEDAKKANKEGVDGSKRVKDVQERIAEAQRRVVDETRALARAREEARQAGVDGAQDVADAQRALGEAHRDVAQARTDGQRQIEDAQRAVADAAAAVADAQTAAATQTAQAASAMSKLAPNAQAFVRAVQGLGPAWNAMRLSVQNELFKGLDTTVTTLGRATIPILQRQLTLTAGVWNQMAKSAAGAITEMAKSGMLEDILAGATKNFSAFAKAPGQVITAFGQLAVAAQPAFNALMTQMAGAIKSFTDGIANSFKSGGLEEATTVAFGILSQFGTLLGNVLGVVVQIFKAASDAGGEIVGTLGAVFGELRDILAAPEMQAAMRTLFGSVAQIVAAIVPVIGTVVQAIVPLLAAIAPPIAQLAQVLGPVLAQLATTLGVALMPIIEALMPVVTLVGEALAQAVGFIEPLLVPIGQLIGALISSLMPVLGPVIGVVVQLVGALAGPLMAVVQALVPMIATLGPIFGQVFGMLMPLIQPLIGIVRQLLMVFVQLYTMMIGQMMAAFMPLVPVITQIVGLVIRLAMQVLAALMPSLMQLVTAVMQLFTALLPILPMLAEFAATLLMVAVQVLTVILPPLTQLATFFITVFVKALTSVINWVTRLVGYISKNLGPILKWVGNVVKTVVGGILKVFRWLYDVLIGHSILPDIVKYIRGPFATVFRWIRDNVIRPVMNGIKSTITTVWEKGIRPVFNALKSAVGQVGKAFDAARKAIKTAWDKVKSIAKAPVKFIIDTVYNGGIVRVWNKVATAFGAPPLKEFHPKGFARGGILPGYTPGRDPHKFYSPTGGALEMSGGEAIMRPEFTRAVGSGFVSTMNSIAKHRGSDGVKAALAPVFGGNPAMPTDRSLRYAGGGVHQSFAGGGVFGWIGKGASAIAGAGSAAWNKIKEGAAWLKDTLEASARAGVNHVVDPLLAKFPGMDTGLGKMLRKIPTKIIDALFGYSKEADKKGAGGVGGPRIKKALNWAKTQHGKKYQWAGNGNPSWDCSGFMSAIESVIRGQKPHRRWATGAFSGKTAPPGWVYHGNSAFKVGITNAGVGHTAGTIAKTNVESRGGDGVVVGKRARSYSSSMFGHSWYGFKPGSYDSGGWLQPGLTAAVNNTGQPEAILTSQQWDAVSSRVTDGGGPSYAYTINARTADFTVADLQRVQRVQEARARVGRPR
ncbi:hypothetical protein [Streptomyces sp. NPDC058268]|uniref:hypothetical protein n=1 Tax=Streptomyces sp. NPDC058268 TaxID=3346413 RepID=UPI0036E3718B